MEGSVGAPPAAADAGQGQAPPAQAPPAPAQAPAQPAAAPPVQPATVPPQQPTPENDIQAQLQRMGDQLQQLQSWQSELSGEQPGDLLSALSPEEDLGYTPEELAALDAGQEPGQVEPGETGEQLAELDAYMDERIQEALEPMVQNQRIEEVRKFGAEHPDIMQPEILERVEATVENLIGRYGDGARYDTGLLNLAYRGAKAELADAGAVPAEQAGESGASIETQAGQAQQGESSAEDDYVNALVGGGPAVDDFSR
jgi:hypothetical protein